MMTSGNRNQGHGRGGGNSGHGQGNQTVSTPTFVPSSGTFIDSVQVAIVCATEGATVRYTTDGSPPTGLSPIYSSPLTLTTTTTIKAIASKNGYVTSAVGQVTLSVLPPCAAPTFEVLDGTYPYTVVIMRCATDGASIYFTTDGSTPTRSSTLFEGGVQLGQSTTFKAIAVKDGYVDSSVVTQAYTVTMPAPYVFPDGGNYTTSVNVSMTNDFAGAEIRYTTDGSDPATVPWYEVYTAPFDVTEGTLVRAVAVKAGCANSAETQKEYFITVEPVVFAPVSGSYESPQDVYLSCPTPGASIYYTMADYPTVPADPATNGILYDGNAIHITPSTNFRAIAKKDFCTDSAETQAEILLYVTDPPLPPIVTLSNPNMLWNFPSNGRGTLTMDYSVNHSTYPVAFVEFQWSTDDVNWPGSEWNPSDSTTWQQQDVADINAIPEVFYMRARYVSQANTPTPSFAGPWSDSLLFNTGNYPV